MTSIDKYRFLIAAIVVLFVFLLVAEVPARWGNAMHLWARVRERAAVVGTPEELERRRAALEVQWMILKERSFSQGEEHDRTQAGLLEFLNACARSSGVWLASVAPYSLRSGPHWQEIPFRVELRERFHRVGAFISAMESATIPIRVTKGEIISRPSTKDPLDVQLEAVAYLPAPEEQP